MADGNAEFETGLTLSGTLDVSKITRNNSGIKRLSVAEAWIKGDKRLRKKCLKFGIAILFVVLIVLIVLVIQKVNRVSNSGPYYVSECNVVDKSQQHNSCYSKKIDKKKYRYAYTINSDYCQSNGISYSMVWFQYCQHKDIRLNIGDTKKCWINKCSTEDALLTFENPILKYYLPVCVYLVLSIICVGFMIGFGYKHCKISLNDDDDVDSLEDVPLEDININDDIGNRSPGSSIGGRNGNSTPSIVGRNGIKRIIKSDNFIALENNSDSDDAKLGVLLSVDSDDMQDWVDTINFDDNIKAIIMESVKSDGDRIFTFSNASELTTYLRIKDDGIDLTNNQYLTSIQQRKLYEKLRTKYRQLLRNP